MSWSHVSHLRGSGLTPGWSTKTLPATRLLVLVGLLQRQVTGVAHRADRVIGGRVSDLSIIAEIKCYWIFWLYWTIWDYISISVIFVYRSWLCLLGLQIITSLNGKHYIIEKLLSMMVPRPLASASSGNLLEMHLSGPAPEMLNQIFYGVGPSHPCIKKSSRWFWNLLLFKNPYFISFVSLMKYRVSS